MRKLVQNVLLRITAVSVGVLIAGCTPTGQFEDTGEATPREYLAQQLWAAHRSSGYVTVAENFADNLPNQSFILDGKDIGALSSGVIVGTVESVEGIAGYSVSDEGSEEIESTTVPFGAEDALWRTAILNIAVTRGTEGFAAGTIVPVGVAIYSDVEATIQGYHAMGEVLVVIDDLDPQRYEGKAHPIVMNKSLLGAVDEDGVIWFDALSAGYTYDPRPEVDSEEVEYELATRDEFLGGLTTVDKVFEEVAIVKSPKAVSLDG